MIDIILIQLSIIYGILMVLAIFAVGIFVLVSLACIVVSVIAIAAYFGIDLIDEWHTIYRARRARIQDANDRKQIEREQEARRVAALHSAED